MYAHLSEPPPPLTARRPDLPPRSMRCWPGRWPRPPEDRYPSCREFADALRQAFGLAAL